MKSQVLKMKSLAVIVAFFFLGTLFIAPQAEANVKHLLLGAGLGVVGGALVGPMLAGGLSAAGGIIGGAVAAVGGALAGVAGAVGSGVLAVAASPFFIPVVCVAGGLLIGKVIYDKAKNSNSRTVSADKKQGIFSKMGSKVSSLFNTAKNGVSAVTGTGKKADTTGVILDAQESAHSVSLGEPNKGVSTISANGGRSLIGQDAVNESAEATLKSQYEAAYQRYVDLLQSGKTVADPDVQAALANYKALYQQYQSLSEAK